MSANYRNPNFLLPNELNQSINPDLSVDRHSLYSTEFNGSSSYIDLGSDTSLNIGGDLTISAWVYVSVHKNFNFIISKFTDASNRNYELYVRNEANVTFVSNSDSTNSTTTIPINTWTHVAVTVQSGVTNGTKFYFNGTLDTTTGTTTVVSQTNATTIGRRSTGLYNFTGKIDEVALFNTALTQGQVQALADSKNSPVNIMALDPKPIAYYPLGEEARNTGYLSSGSDVSGSEWQFPNQVVQSTVVDFNTNSAITANIGQSNMPVKEHTISLWLKRPNTSSTNWYALSCPGSQAPVFGIQPTGNGINYYTETTGGGVKNAGITGANAILQNWTHILGVYDGSSTKLYVNGDLAATNNNASGDLDYNNVQDSFFIGGYSAGGYFIDGEISNVQLWNTNLTEPQIENLYNGGSPLTSTQPQLSNLKAWYKLNAANSSYAPHSANFNSALSFDGQNDYMTFSNFNSLSGKNTFSVSFWANFNDSTSGVVMMHNSVLGIKASVTNRTMDVRWQAVDGTNVIAASPNQSTDGAWTHYACTYDNTDFKLYENGELVRTTNQPSKTYKTSSANLLIGKYWFGSSLFFDGLLSNLSVFDTALDASAISTLYNNGTPETSISGTPENWWKLNAGGTTITDYGSGGNNGTNSGATLVSSPVAVEQWNFTDSAGSNNGTSTTLPISALVRSDLQFESPYSNFSLYFDGVGDYLTSNNVPAQLNTVSLSIWVKREGDQATASTGVFGVRNPGVGSGTFGVCWDLVLYSNKITWRIGDSDPTLNQRYRTVQQNTALSDNTWTHVVGVADGENMFLYINGVKEAATNTYTAPIETPTNRIHIATDGSNNSWEFKGMLDEAAIFNYGLSEAQVNQIYNNGLAANLTSLSPINWWRLGEDAYFVNNNITIPNQVAGGDSCTGSGTQTSMLVADAPGSYGSGSGVNLDIFDRVGEAPGISPINVGNSQSYNMIPDDRHGYVPGYVPAQVNNVASMDFDGVNDYFSVPISDLNSATACTLSYWGKKTASNKYLSIGSQITTTNGIWLIWWNDGNVYFSPRNGAFTATSSALSFDTGWHHFAGVYDGSSVKLYIDGNLVNTSTTNVPSSLSTSVGDDFNIGYLQSQYTSGSIDEVAIFNYALTPRQIKEDIFNASKEVGGVKKTADLNNNSKLTAPVAWYRMGD